MNRKLRIPAAAADPSPVDETPTVPVADAIAAELVAFKERNPHVNLADFLENIGRQVGLLSRA